MARTLIYFVARKLNTSPLVAQILLLSIMYLLWSESEGSIFDPILFLVFWGISGLVVIISIMLEGRDWVKKDFENY